jgi:excisionase family DNA binding protein
VSKQTTGQGPNEAEDFSSKLITVTEASERCGLSASHVRKLVREGQIKGLKVGWSWLTTEEAVREYLKEERRPGPKPK